MDATTALISNAPSVVAALSDLDRIGMISFLIVLVIGLWFNQRNTAKALNSLEDVIKVLAKDLEVRNKGVDGEIKEILSIMKSVDKEILEIKHTCAVKNTMSPWDPRYQGNTCEMPTRKRINDGEHIH